MIHAKLATITGIMYHQWGQFHKSMLRQMECLEICEKELDPNDGYLAGMYNNLGNVAESMGDLEAAITWHEKSWKIRSTIDDVTGENMAHSKANIARSFLMLGRDEEAIKNLDDAEATFQSCDAWFHESQWALDHEYPYLHLLAMSFLICSIHYVKANLYLKNGDYKSAKVRYQKALYLLVKKAKAPQHTRTATCLYKLGVAAIDEKDYAPAM